jgi:glutamate:GABA antiporter
MQDMSEVLLEDLSRERPLPSEEYAVKVLPPVLKTFDLTTIFIVVLFTSPVIMSAMFAGAATFTYWVFMTIVYLIPCVIATAQLGFLHPNEGALYNWTHKAFGGYWCFFVSFCTWIPCILVMVSGASVIVGYVQALNMKWIWLAQSWQQGLAIIVILCVCAAFSLQRFRTVQNFVNLVTIFLGLGVLTVGVSGVVWLLQGHAPATDYGHWQNWMMTFGDAKNPSNVAAFGVAVYSVLGMEAPLNMGAEIVGIRGDGKKRRQIIIRHLCWGTALVIIGYLIDAFGVLTVMGPQKANGNIFAFVTTADTALGKGWGDLVGLCIISFFIVEIIVYNYAYARLVLCSGIDQRLPRKIAHINRNRIPANAIVIQTIIAAAFTAVTYVMIPYFQSNQAQAVALANIVYNVSQGAATVLWTASTAVLFVDVSVLYFRDRAFFLRNRIFPIPILTICVIIGSLASIATIADTLFYSWVPDLVTDGQWRNIVGSITVICLIIAGIGSMFANSQAEWEKFEQINKDQTTTAQRQLSSTS